MERNCLECGSKILGRIDKKFCNDSCRNTYNNKLNKDRRNLVRNTNNRLRKNYRILEELNPDQKTKVSRGKLILDTSPACTPPKPVPSITLFTIKVTFLWKMTTMLW